MTYYGLTDIGRIGIMIDECKEKIARKEEILRSIKPVVMEEITAVIADTVASGINVRLAGKRMSSRHDCWHTSFELAAKNDPGAKDAAFEIKTWLNAQDSLIEKVTGRIKHYRFRLAWLEDEMNLAWRREERVLAEKLLKRVADKAEADRIAVGPLCRWCEKHVPKSEYSASQLKKKGSRKCRECVGISSPTVTPLK